MIAQRRRGKSYTAGVLAEEFLRIGAQTVILDPIGNWYGLRLRADGKTKGFSIPIFGGRHGDIPLEPTGGRLMARVIHEHDSSAIIDISMFSKTKMRQFVADFLEELYLLKNEDNPTAMHIIFEEAHLFAPQKAAAEVARMKGAVEDVVRLGRNRGIGCTLVDQRPQSVDKDVLNQVECLIVGGLNGAHERRAISAWIKEQGVDIENLVDTLPKLKVGVFWVWSPSWLELFKKVKIRKKLTFDSTKTPKVGEKKVKAAKLKPIDLERIEKEMAETIEHIESNNPRHLKKRIIELEHQIKELESNPPTEIEEYIEYEEIPVPILKKPQMDQFERACNRFNGDVDKILELSTNMANILKDAREVFEHDGSLPEVEEEVEETVPPPEVSKPRIKKEVTDAADYINTSVGKGPSNIMRVLAFLDPKAATKQQLVLMSGLRRNSVNKYLTILGGATLAEGAGSGRWRLTSLGKAEVGEIKQPSSDVLIDQWKRKLGRGPATIFEHLIECHPDGLSKDEIEERVALKRNSVNKYMTTLSTMELATKQDGLWMASDDLFY